MAKDWWDKTEILSKIAGALLIPVVLGIGGYYINSGLKSKEIEQKYVDTALRVLTTEPKKENMALRAWAVNVVNKYSPVPLSEDAKKTLKERPLPRRFVETPVSSTTAVTTLTDEKGTALTDEKGNPLTVEESGAPQQTRK